jgi:hypothetical protein
MAVAFLPGNFPRDQVTRGLEVEHVDLRLDQRRGDPLAFAGALAVEKSQHDSIREQQPRGSVVDRDADANRTAFGMPRDGHQPAHTLRDLVDAGTRRVRAVLPEARDTAVDDARVDLLHRLVIHAELVLDRRPVILHDHVGGLCHLHENLETFRGLEVER